jgi:hypothetical protein
MDIQTLMNLAYGYQVRLAGLIRRGADQSRIDTVRELYENAIREIQTR